MSSALGSLTPFRVERSPRRLGLALGDVLTLTTFIVIGELRHNVSPLTEPLVVADTIAPFLLGWLVVAVAVGAYGPRATASVGQAATVAAATWVGAAVIGLALRATDLFHGDAPLSFALVVTGVGLLFFVGWRSVAAALDF